MIGRGLRAFKNPGTNGGPFVEITQALGLDRPECGDKADGFVTPGDWNNDGRTDLYVANMYSKAGNRILANVDRTRYPEELYRKLEEGTRGSRLYAASDDESYRILPERDMFSNVGWAYGPAFVDLDNDGWLDLLVANGYLSSDEDGGGDL